jgi:hypothetical protein
MKKEKKKKKKKRERDRCINKSYASTNENFNDKAQKRKLH